MFVSKSKSNRCVSPLTRVEVAVVLCHQCRSWRSSSLSPELRNYALLAPAHALTCSLIHSIIHSPAQSVITTFSHSLTLTHTNSLTCSISNYIQLFGSFQESSFNDKQGPPHSGLTKVGLLRKKCITEMWTDWWSSRALFAQHSAPQSYLCTTRVRVRGRGERRIERVIYIEILPNLAAQ